MNDKNRPSNAASLTGSLEHYLPSLLWLVRDFHLELVDEYNSPITMNEYLEIALKSQPGFSPQIQEKNKIKNLLKKYFPKRECYCIVRPADEERNLQTLNLGGPGVRDKFAKQFRELYKIIYKSIKIKTINGVMLNTQSFIKIIQNYVEAVNDGEV
jgi:hypothetical protein